MDNQNKERLFNNYKIIYWVGFAFFLIIVYMGYTDIRSQIDEVINLNINIIVIFTLNMMLLVLIHYILILICLKKSDKKIYVFLMRFASSKRRPGKEYAIIQSKYFDVFMIFALLLFSLNSTGVYSFDYSQYIFVGTLALFGFLYYSSFPKKNDMEVIDKILLMDNN